MIAAPVSTAERVKLLPKVVCPHCWERFAPEDILWVSEHTDLLGDPLLGRDFPQRFLPSRFTPEGDALDARNLVCRGLACPKCHLDIPRAALEMEPLFLSILGAPASGKSFFLASATWRLRETLSELFGVAFQDADPGANRALNEAEETLFLHPQPDRPVPLGDLIRKTELQGDMYDSVTYGHHTVTYPRPYLIGLRPTDKHPQAASARSMARLLCLYDNAGEHFQPGQDTATSPVTRHLALSSVLMFLYDPTQDPRFRAAIGRAGRAPGADGRTGRQETILAEAIARIRRHAGLAQGAKYDRPLIVILSKLDAWSGLLGTSDDDEPWKGLPNRAVAGLHVDAIERRSAELRRLLVKYCPEVTSTAEAFASEVVYIAVSALGHGVETDRATGLSSIPPGRIRPSWVTVPFLYALQRTVPSLIPRLVRRT